MCASERRAALALLALALSAGPARALAEPPRPMVVPKKLAARSDTLEASGLVWAAPLDRYLVVSDDAGPKGAHHQPWVLAMSRDGRLDEEPVPILGADEINDAESICAAPSGRFFLTTSHSLDKKGWVPPSRRQLLLLELVGRTLRVVGRVDLRAARDARGRGLPALAGLDPDGRLDVEALTFRDGALFVGLKSPLSAERGAVVLRLAEPLRALAQGAIEPGALTRLWELPLTATPRGVGQGIADMTSLPDGSLALVANAPKGAPDDGGGALYRLEPGRPPQLIRWFAGLRPEGVTVSPDGKALIVVFDNKRDPPSWIRLPLPLGGPS